MTETDGAYFIELTADIVSAYVSNNSISAHDLPGLISEVFQALSRTNGGVVEAEPFRVQPVEEEHRLQSVTHHLSPGLLIRLVRDMTGAKPKAFLVSVRGYDFDFGDGLTDACSANVLCATARILQMIGKG